MPSCTIKNCSNHSRKTKKSEGVTFHRFLHPGHVQWQQWVQFVQENRNDAKWLPSEHTYICSLHFKNDDKYSTKTGRTYLKKTAVPQIYKTLLESGESELPQKVSAPESNVESCREIQLKYKLSTEIAARKALADKLIKARRQNRHLKHRCECYRKIITSLKEKFDIDFENETDLIVNAIKKDKKKIATVSTGSVAASSKSVKKENKTSSNIDPLTMPLPEAKDSTNSFDPLAIVVKSENETSCITNIIDGTSVTITVKEEKVISLLDSTST